MFGKDVSVYRYVMIVVPDPNSGINVLGTRSVTGSGREYRNVLSSVI